MQKIFYIYLIQYNVKLSDPLFQVFVTILEIFQTVVSDFSKCVHN
jgi:hypothetical protein